MEKVGNGIITELREWYLLEKSVKLFKLRYVFTIRLNQCMIVYDIFFSLKRLRPYQMDTENSKDCFVSVWKKVEVERRLP